jgi:adenosylhomocysteinase
MPESRDSRPDLETRLRWAGRHMPLTKEEIRLLPDLHGVRLACSIHIEPKMTAVLEGILEHGAALFLTTCSPSTVRDEVVERLQGRGAAAHAWNGMAQPDVDEAERAALEWGPTHLWETGADLSAAAAAAPAGTAAVSAGGFRRTSIRASMESTGSGISRLRALAAEGRFPGYPVFNCDDVPIKEGLHNRYLVGQTAWQTFTSRTQLSLHRKRVVVVGYGLVGRGVALTARSLGGGVSVAERDPARSLEALYDGFPVGTLDDLAAGADIVVTATGARRVVAARHIKCLPDGCFLMNVGHRGDEIDVESLGERRLVLPFVEEARVAGKTVYLIAGGAMANMTAGPGDTLNSFDITLAVMLSGLRYVLSEEAAAHLPGLHPLPRAAWEGVARRAAGFGGSGAAR